MISKLELALAALKKNRKIVKQQLVDLESELIFCFLSGPVMTSLVEAYLTQLEELDEAIALTEVHLEMQKINAGLGLEVK